MPRQAKKQGELGVNGEFYKGGRFLPENPNKVKGQEFSKKKSKKVEVAPYVYEELPENFTSIYQSINQFVNFNDKSIKLEICEYCNRDVTEIEKLLTAYTCGCKFYQITEKGIIVK